MPFRKIVYNDALNSTSWKGVCACDEAALASFMQRDVAERLNDTALVNEFQDHLRGLELTGLAKNNLENVLNAKVNENRDWAVGEALSEAVLMGSHGIIFPWNMERDKRNGYGSLPGADIIGFIPSASGYRFALGEVKTSSEDRCPPQIMSGRSGHMGHQIDALAHDMSVICQLLFWLHPRCKGTPFQSMYDHAAIQYFESGNKSVSLFGILVRDTKPNENDLKSRGTAIGNMLGSPTTCELIAVYIPWPIVDLPTVVKGGGKA